MVNRSRTALFASSFVVGLALGVGAAPASMVPIPAGDVIQSPENVAAPAVMDGDANVKGFIQKAAVPESSTWAMMLIGFAGFGFVACRFRRRPKPRLGDMV